MRAFKIVLFLLVLCLAMAGINFGQDTLLPLELYKKIKEAPLDETMSAEVENLALTRDVATFRLNEGKICLLQPVEGRVTGAVFMGKGIFEFASPTDIERYQLKRFTEVERLEEEFDWLYLAFSDTTGVELKNKLTFFENSVPGKYEGIRKDSPRRLLDKTGRNLWARIFADMMADSTFLANHPERSHGFFYAEIHTDRLGSLFFTFDTKQVEEIVLEKPTGLLERFECDLVCSFHKRDDYLRHPDAVGAPIPHENKDEIKSTHYTMDVTIDQNELLTARVEMEYEALVDGARVIDFLLATKLADNIEEISDEQGRRVLFFWEKDQLSTTVVLPQATRSGQSGKLVFKYSGKVIDQNWFGDFYIRASTYWYPQYGYLQRATFDVTFNCPGGYKLVSIGDKTGEWTEGDYCCTRWEEHIPVFAASFNYGHFDVYEMEYEDIPPVSIYYLEDSHRKLVDMVNRPIIQQYFAQDFAVLDSKGKEHVGADVVNSLNFFQTVYGPYPFSKIAATEIPAYHGQGLPGLLHLSWGTFEGDGAFAETRLWEESFRAHEVSHQWWGHVVGWHDYHDQWLSEGFAEYSGIWFAQMSMKDNEAFFEELERWQKEIMGGGSKFSEGTKAGPLWLGARLHSSKSSDYTTLVYKKGAFVLHMLRNMMMDFDNKSDEKFREMMRDFVQTHRGTNATTEDFKVIVEKHMGEDMDWFFDQWVYGVEIPIYIFSYDVEQVADKYVVSCEIEQENVPEDFKMWVPVLLDFGGDMYAVLRLWVNKPHNEYKLPRAPLPPREVVLNPFHAVLCEVKNK
jgi:hypothetical protein